MKFKIKTNELKKITKKMTMSSPFILNKIELTGFLIKAFENKITFESKNEIISLKKILEEKFETFKEGKVLIKAKLFDEIISKINDEYVEIFTMGDNVLTIKSENFNYELNLMNIKEFEEENFNINVTEEIKLKNNIFRNIFNKVIFSGDERSPRRIFQGVNFIIEEGKIKVISSDNSRATITKSFVKDFNLKLNKIIPIKVLKEILRIFADSSELKILFSQNKLLIISDGFILKANLIEGIYPDVEKMFPTKFKNLLEINKTEILTLIESSIAINFNKSSNTNIVKMIFGNDEINIEFRELEIGYSNLRTKNFHYQGDKNFYISFNTKFFIEALKNVEDETIKVGFNNSNSPFMIFGKKQDEYRSLILPYLLN